MKVIKPNFSIINEPDWDEVIISLERAIRTCYKSEKKIDAGTADRLIRSIISRGHESTLEHHSMTVRFVCDRGVSHELVRHRHCSFSQESTRYVNYEGQDMQFILPRWMQDILCREYSFVDDILEAVSSAKDTGAINWLNNCWYSNQQYDELVSIKGWKPEQARSVLPNSLKTEIVVTTNMRDWRHIFMLRCDKTAHPQMRELMVPLWQELFYKCPALFDSVRFNLHDDDHQFIDGVV